MNLTQLPDSRQQYKYFAFISYSSKDIAWGRYLQNKLERYRLPARLTGKRKDTPDRAYPIFRDETDLAGFKVRDALEKELAESKYLIVICSPQSARSAWVNDEVRYFVEHGWEDRILPFITEGLPYSADPETECFPPALRSLTNKPLGVDVTALGKRKAFLRLVSTLLDVRFDELVRRDSARRVRNRIIWGILGLLAAAALVFGIWYNTEHTRYYNAVTYQYELPVGLYPLTKEEYAGASDTYRITTLRGKVIRLENVNSLGVVRNPDFTSSLTDFPLVEYLYDDDGELISIIQKDATGKEVFRKKLTINKQTREIAIDFYSPSNTLNAMALSADLSYSIINDPESETRSEITRQRNTYDENGFLIRTLYQRDNLGTPACDSNGVYGKAYQYDALGQQTGISYLNEQGEVFNCKYGYAHEKTVYDEQGNIVLSTIYDASGNPVCNQSGFFALRLEYDRFSNPVKQVMLDAQGQVLDAFFVHTFTYDAQGFMTSHQFFHTDNTPAHDEYGVHQYRLALDSRGRVCGEDYWNTLGKPFYSPGLSCASYRMTLDDAGRMLTLNRYDAEGEPTCDRETGTYGMQCSYDENGYLCQTTYLDAQGKPAMCKNGYASWSAQLDSDGHQLRDEYRDAQGNLINTYANIAIAESEYDAFGNCVRRSFYDEKGEPAYHSGGYSSVVYTYEDGNRVRVQYFDADGQPMLCGKYYHEVRYDYDLAGNRIRWSYFDTEGNPVSLKDNYAVVEKDYDRYGNVTSNRFYDTDMEPVMHADNLYAATFAYDSHGNMIREQHHSLAPELLPFVVKESTYDDRGNVLSESYYMEDGQPRDTESKAARIEFAYDNCDNLLEVRWLDSNGLPKHADAQAAENLRRYTYDDLGQQTLIRHMHRDSSGTDTCLWQERFTYDSNGNCILTEKLDGSGALSPNDDGYAAVEQAYSPSGYVILEAYYDENGDPVLKEDTAFRYTFVRDGAGKILEERRYDTDGKLLQEAKEQIAIICYAYDSRGNRIEKQYLNETEAPFGTEASPISRIVYQIDGMGYPVGRLYYDKHGTVVGEYDLYTYIERVHPGSAAEAAGVQENDFLLSLNDWELFHTDTTSRLHDLQEELARSTHTEKALTFCRWTTTDAAPQFYQVRLPEGMAGYTIQSDTGNAKIVAQMEAAYNRWKENS